MKGIEGLIDKIEKDIQRSTNQISSLQSQIQKVVAERKEKKLNWEKVDQNLENEIAELLSELSTAQGRQLTGQELIDYLNK